MGLLKCIDSVCTQWVVITLIGIMIMIVIIVVVVEIDGWFWWILYRLIELIKKGLAWLNNREIERCIRRGKMKQGRLDDM